MTCFSKVLRAKKISSNQQKSEGKEKKDEKNVPGLWPVGLARKETRPAHVASRTAPFRSARLAASPSHARARPKETVLAAAAAAVTGSHP
jgi:hypothetical protein